MGILDKFRKEKPLSHHATQVGRVFHTGFCGICSTWFRWLDQGVPMPTPIGVSRRKPDQELLDIGGWCPKCDRLMCHEHARWVPYTLKGEDYWAAGCPDCQEPLQGLDIRTVFVLRQAAQGRGNSS